MPIHGNGGHAKVVRELAFSHPRGWIIAVGNNLDRRRISKRSKKRFCTAVHETAIISPSASIGEGSVIMAGAIVQAHATIGRHCILNTGCSVDHDCLLHDFVHIAPGARLCGAVEVGEGAFISAGAICVPGAKVPPWTHVKAGTVFKSKEWRENYKERVAVSTYEKQRRRFE